LGKVEFLLVGHVVIGSWKVRKKEKTNALTVDLWKDQALHFVQLVMVTVV